MVFSRRMSDLASASEDRCLDRDIPWVRLLPCRAISCDRYEWASIVSTDSFLVSAGEALEQVAENNGGTRELRGSARVGQARSIWLIWFVWSIWFVWFFG
jgi:hypothetical protein